MGACDGSGHRGFTLCEQDALWLHFCRSSGMNLAAFAGDKPKSWRVESDINAPANVNGSPMMEVCMMAGLVSIIGVG
jgi:predicted nicotinamide N-methyase